ncbi:MAG: HAD-IA family hydrolase [bacterium]
MKVIIKAVFFDAIDTLFGAYPDKVGMYMRIIEEHTGMKISRGEMTIVWDKMLKETELLAQSEATDSKESNQAWTDFNKKMLDALNYKGNSTTKGQELHFEAWGNPKNFYLYKDVIPTLEFLKNQNILIGCVSNEDGYLNKFFEQFGIDKYFKFVITSEEIGCEKPNPGIFKEAINISRIKAEEILFVGDSLISDYNGSANVGMNPVLIDREDIIKDDNIVKISKLSELKGIINV